MASGIIYDDNISRQGAESLMAERINENINQAIDIIVSKKLEGLAFDKTEICLIEKANENTEEYTVNNGSISYTARAKKGEYKEGQQVYVQIPNNDYDNVKTITGIYADPSLNMDNYYINIFDSFIDATGNIFDNENIIDGSVEKEIAPSLVANWGDKKKYILGNENDFVIFKRPIDYDIFAFSFGLNTRLYSVTSGTYGIAVELKIGSDVHEFKKQTNRENGYSDFSGNPYVYSSYVTQQFKMDISSMREVAGANNTKISRPVEGIRVYVFQNDDFVTKNGRLEYEENVTPAANILFNNFQIDFGFPPIAEDGVIDKIYLSTPDSPYYTRTNIEESFARRIKLNWVHIFNKTEEGETSIPMVLNSKEDFNTYRLTDHLTKLRISWYEWKEVASEDIDSNTGKFWKKLSSTCWTAIEDGLLDKNSWLAVDGNVEDPFTFQADIEPNTNSATYKVFIEYGQGISLDGKEEDTSRISTVESEEITFYATVPKAEGLRSKDLIEGLSLSVDDDTRGQYYLYDQATNQLFSSVEKSRIRKIYAEYHPAEQEEQSVDFPVGSTVYWKVPKSDTQLNFLLSQESWEKDIDKKELERIFGEDDANSIKYTFWKQEIAKKEVKKVYLQYTIKDEYAKTQTENSVECKLTNENGEQICGGRMNFFFSFLPPSKTIIDPYWGETYILKVSGNGTSNRGEILAALETNLKNSEALPVGGYLASDVNYRYATKIGVRIYGYSGNPLFTTEETSFSNVYQVLSNVTVQMGNIYDKEMNFSVVGGSAPIVKIGGSNELVTDNKAYAKIEGQNTSTDTGTNLIFYNNELYYISPLGKKTGGPEEGTSAPWLYAGDLENTCPEVINFKFERLDGEKVSASLPVHFFRTDFDFTKVKIKSNIIDCNYNLLSGADLVVYDENGTLMSGTSNPYELGVSNSSASVTWKIFYIKKDSSSTYRSEDGSRYFSFVGGYLQHNSESLPIERAFYIAAYLGGGTQTPCYIMPLRLIQKKYGLSLLSDWSGENAPTIFGEKTDGEFSGVFSGYNSIQRYSDGELVKEDGAESDKEEEEESVYGFYGYQDGYSTFALQNKDPYFTIKGLVKENGKVAGQSTIFQAGQNALFLRSMNYETPSAENSYKGEGMEINLVDGRINSHDVNSVLYAKEIAVLTQVGTQTAKMDENGLKVSGTAEITGQTKLGDLTTTGSTSITNGSGDGLTVDNENGTVLVGATLKSCILEGDFEAEKATIKGVTIEDGSIKWSEAGSEDSQNEILNLEKLQFHEGKGLISNLRTLNFHTDEGAISNIRTLAFNSGAGSISNLRTLGFVGNATATGLSTLTFAQNGQISSLNKITFSGNNSAVTGLNSLETNELIIDNKELKQIKIPLKEDTNGNLIFDKEATESNYTSVWVFVEREEGD